MEQARKKGNQVNFQINNVKFVHISYLPLKKGYKNTKYHTEVIYVDDVEKYHSKFKQKGIGEGLGRVLWLMHLPLLFLCFYQRLEAFIYAHWFEGPH